MRQKLIDWIERVEGGYVDDPVDRGGKTNMGITHATLQRAYEAEIVDYFDILKLTKEDAIAIYEDFFYYEAGCNKLPDPLDWVHFDTAVNSSTDRAVKILQQTINDFAFADIKVDGDFGPKTLATLSEVLEENDQVGIINTYLLHRCLFLNNILEKNKDQIKWLRGWIERVEALKLAVS